MAATALEMRYISKSSHLSQVFPTDLRLEVPEFLSLLTPKSQATYCHFVREPIQAPEHTLSHSPLTLTLSLSLVHLPLSVHSYTPRRSKGKGREGEGIRDHHQQQGGMDFV